MTAVAVLLGLVLLMFAVMAGAAETFSVTTTAQTVSGDQFIQNTTVTGTGIERSTVSIPAAKTGTLTTRTDANTGVATMDSGHGFATSDKIDLYWSGGSRRQMDATVATNAVTLDGGSGDDLPAANTAITAMKATIVDFTVDGDEVKGVGVYSPVPGWIVFVDDADAEISDATYRITESSGAGRSWVEGNGADNPLTGSVTSKVKFSHGSTSARELKAAAVFGTPP